MAKVQDDFDRELPEDSDRIAKAMADDSGWEEKGTDNGTLTEWREGTVASGVYLDRRTITLPVSEQNPLGGEADMLVFEGADGKRWSTWLTYQLEEAFDDIPVGDLVRIECLGERKAKIGNVKVFSVKSKPLH